MGPWPSEAFGVLGPAGRRMRGHLDGDSPIGGKGLSQIRGRTVRGHRNAQGRWRRRRPAKLEHGSCDSDISPTPSPSFPFSLVRFSSARLSFHLPLPLTLSPHLSYLLRVAPRSTSPHLHACPHPYPYPYSHPCAVRPVRLHCTIYHHRNAGCSLCLDDCHRAVDARIHTSITRSRSHVVYSMLRRPTVIRPEGLRRLPSVRSRDPLILHLLDMLPAGTRAPTHMHICTSVLIAPSL